MSNESEIEWKVEIRNNIEVPGNMVPILTIHPDGRVIVSDRLQPEKTAELVLDQIKKQWLADAQATKIREQQEHITELEGRLRVLWDKLEGERKHYNERINRLEEAGDELLDWIGSDVSDANRKLIIDSWRNAKEAKP